MAVSMPTLLDISPEKPTTETDSEENSRKAGSLPIWRRFLECQLTLGDMVSVSKGGRRLILGWRGLVVLCTHLQLNKISLYNVEVFVLLFIVLRSANISVQNIPIFLCFHFHQRDLQLSWMNVRTDCNEPLSCSLVLALEIEHWELPMSRRWCNDSSKMEGL